MGNNNIVQSYLTEIEKIKNPKKRIIQTARYAQRFIDSGVDDKYIDSFLKRAGYNPDTFDDDFNKAYFHSLESIKDATKATIKEAITGGLTGIGIEVGLPIIVKRLGNLFPKKVKKEAMAQIKESAKKIIPQIEKQGYTLEELERMFPAVEEVKTGIKEIKLPAGEVTFEEIPKPPSTTPATTKKVTEVSKGKKATTPKSSEEKIKEYEDIIGKLKTATQKKGEVKKGTKTQIKEQKKVQPKTEQQRKQVETEIKAEEETIEKPPEKLTEEAQDFLRKAEIKEEELAKAPQVLKAKEEIRPPEDTTLKEKGFIDEEIGRMTPATKDRIIAGDLKPEQVSILSSGELKVIPKIETITETKPSAKEPLKAEQEIKPPQPIEVKETPEALLQEARKYKSAEEFVKAKDEIDIVLRQDRNFKIGQAKLELDVAIGKKKIFVSGSDVALAINRDKLVKIDGKYALKDKITPEIQQKLDNYNKISQEAHREYAQKTPLYKTEQQLIDIWNKAHQQGIKTEMPAKVETLPSEIGEEISIPSDSQIQAIKAAKGVKLTEKPPQVSQPAPEKIPPKKGKIAPKYNIVNPKEYFVSVQQSTGEITWSPVKGEPIKIKGYEDIDLFLHKKINKEGKNLGWEVSEGKTGRSLTINRSLINSKTKQEAINIANHSLQENEGKINELIESYIQQTGLSPRYIKVEKLPEDKIRTELLTNIGLALGVSGLSALEPTDEEGKKQHQMLMLMTLPLIAGQLKGLTKGQIQLLEKNARERTLKLVKFIESKAKLEGKTLEQALNETGLTESQVNLVMNSLTKLQPANKIQKEQAIGVLENINKGKIIALKSEEGIPMVINISNQELENLQIITEKPLVSRIGERFLENPIRVIEEMPKPAKEMFYYPFRYAENDSTVEKKALWKEFNELTKGLTQKNSERIMQYALGQEEDGRILLKRLEKEIPELTSPELNVYNWMRNKYDEILDRYNKVRTYAGVKPIPKRKDYFTHIRQLSALEELGFNLGLQEDIPDLIAKNVHLKAPSFRYAISRKPKAKIKIEMDAFNVFHKYMDKAIANIHLTPPLAKARKYLGRVVDPETKEVIFSYQDRDPIGHKWLTAYLDFIAGQKIITGLPRTVETAFAALNKNLIYSTLSWGFRSALIQPSAYTNTVSEIGIKWSIEGIRSLFNPTEGLKFAMKHSKTLRAREFESSLREALDESSKIGYWASQLQRAKTVIAAKGIKPLQILDLQTAGATWLGAYKKAISEGMLLKDAVDYADDVVVKTQASASKMDLAPIQRNVLGKTLTLFQTFTINNWGFITRDVLGIGKTTPVTKKEIMRKLFLYLGGASLINYMYEDILKVTSPLPNPIGAFTKKLEEGKDEDIVNISRALMAAGKETITGIPIIGGMRYSGTPYGATLEYIEDVFTKIGRPQESNVSILELTSKSLLGIPGTAQIEKVWRASTEKIPKKRGVPTTFSDYALKELIGGKVKLKKPTIHDILFGPEYQPVKKKIPKKEKETIDKERLDRYIRYMEQLNR